MYMYIYMYNSHKVIHYSMHTSMKTITKNRKENGDGVLESMQTRVVRTATDFMKLILSLVMMTKNNM